MAKIIDLHTKNLATIGALKAQNAVEIKIPDYIEEGNEDTRNTTNLKEEIKIKELKPNYQYKNLIDEERNKGVSKAEIDTLETTKIDETSVEGKISTSYNLQEKHVNTINEAQDASNDNPAIQAVSVAKFNKEISELPESQKIHSRDLATRPFKKSATQGEILKITPEEVDRKDAEKRVANRQMTMFLYSALPYIGTRAVAGAQTAVSNLGANPQLLGVISALKSVGGFLKKVKYFKVSELIKTLAHNFYTLHFTRGITVKKGQGGFMFLTLPGKDWDGLPDISYGKNFFNFNLFGMLRAKLRDLFTLPKGASNLTPSERDNYELSQFKQGSVKSMSDIGVNTKTTIINLQADQRKIETYGVNIKTDPAAILETPGEENFQKPKGTAAGGGGGQKDPNLGPAYEDVRFIDIAYKHGLFDAKSNGIDILFSEKKGATKDDVFTVILPSGEKSTITDAIAKKSFLKTEEGHWQVGALLVMPITSSDLSRFYIPFEFNPVIELGGMNARYQANNYLSRIGNLQTFTGVESQTITINTKYYAVSHDGQSGTTDGQGWMNNFTLEKIQAIELAYNSLVMPHFPQEDDKSVVDTGYKYIKPPLIKVIIGGKTENAPFSNLLTYQRDGIIKDYHLKNDTYDKFYKTFIVTGVQINKHMEDYPMYLDDDLKMLDTFGFDVSLNLTEVTPGYMDMVPDFKDLSEGYLEVMGSFEIKDKAKR